MDSFPRPSKRSFQEELCDLQNSCVNKILDDDYSPRDAINSTLKMTKGSPSEQTVMKYGSNFEMKTVGGNASFNYSDNFEYQGHFGKVGMKGKIKNGSFSEHYDFGFRKCDKQWGGKNMTVWYNPYMRWSGKTDFTNIGVSLGMANYWCKNFDHRVQLNYDPSKATDSESAWSLTDRKRFWKGKFWLEACGQINLASIASATLKTLRMGWNESNWKLMLVVKKLQLMTGGCPIKDSVSIGGSWNMNKIGNLAARVHHFMDDRPLGYEVGWCKKLCSAFSMKGKVDQDWNFNVHGKWDYSKDLAIEGSWMTNLADPEKVTGIYDLPFKMGLKMKLNK